MQSIQVKFGDEKQQTTLKEIADYLFAFLEDEIHDNLGTDAANSFAFLNKYFMEAQKRCFADVIEEGLEAFYGGARNE